jgi:hypothetical protein
MASPSAAGAELPPQAAKTNMATNITKRNKDLLCDMNIFPQWSKYK